ncbi:hypothetical protein DAEQUDRAFT_215063 [Daedalea quercina L-15889]|uniref:Uncharacterized protein n=1 Tax=Daedalea quercina L-15889 TaxID=1314783 RepID=A0A165R3N3_9APHY|nr:hypothetical protein DAEQUDRAFT_215063 [Daedalea quercina L-15889]
MRSWTLPRLGRHVLKQHDLCPSPSPSEILHRNASGRCRLICRYIRRSLHVEGPSCHASSQSSTAIELDPLIGIRPRSFALYGPGRVRIKGIARSCCEAAAPVLGERSIVHFGVPCTWQSLAVNVSPVMRRYGELCMMQCYMVLLLPYFFLKAIHAFSQRTEILELDMLELILAFLSPIPSEYSTSLEKRTPRAVLRVRA